MDIKLPISVKGHLKITDDLGNVLVDKDNAVHPQNMARAIARSLSNEHNFSVFRMAFGNGGTEVDAAFQITYRQPNDGQPPDTNTWDSRLYNETYSEVCDATSALMGQDIGDADSNTGTRPGGGANPAGDPASVPYVSGPGLFSNELGLTSQVTISVVLNPGEPVGQYSSDQLSPTEYTESSFTFDEIGLYTAGAPAISSFGYQDVGVGNKTTSAITPLLATNTYSFSISVDGAPPVSVDLDLNTITPTGPLGEVTYGDLCQIIWTAFNTGLIAATATITDDSSGGYSHVPANTQTYGFLKFQSNLAGTVSSIVLTDGGGAGLDLFAALGGTIENAVDGQNAGVQNDPVNWNTERERLLTHVIFSPVLKAANRTLAINYTLTVSVARSV